MALEAALLHGLGDRWVAWWFGRASLHPERPTPWDSRRAPVPGAPLPGHPGTLEGAQATSSPSFTGSLPTGQSQAGAASASAMRLQGPSSGRPPRPSQGTRSHWTGAELLEPQLALEQGMP